MVQPGRSGSDGGGRRLRPGGGGHLVERPHADAGAETWETLRTSGAYAIVRHPLYTSVLTVAVGFTIAVGSWWQLAVCCCLAIFFGFKSRWEDSMLAERFGDQWQDYRRATPAIVPLLRLGRR